MADLNSLETLQSLYADLLALSESRLSSIERLGAQLDAHIRDFKNLLDKKPRSDQSRHILANGKLDISGDEYTINEDFQQGTLQVANELNLDELEAARIFLDVQDETDSSGRSAITNSIIRFHQRRKTVLDCLLLIIQQSAEEDQDEALREDLQAIVAQIVQPENGSARYTQRCLSSMGDIKVGLQGLTDSLNRASLLGQAQQVEAVEAIEYQRVSLIKQHESLGVIVVYLIKENHSVEAELDLLLGVLRRADKYDNLLLHYLPALSAFITRFGGSEPGRDMPDARALHNRIFARVDDSNTWALAYVHASVKVIWLAEYSGWYVEHSDGSIPDRQLADESAQRSTQFSEALKDGAFDFILSISADVKAVEWQDPARHGLRQWLQRKVPVILTDTVPFSPDFQKVLMEQLEGFIESFITNLPDVVRKLRTEEDEQRQSSKEHEHDLDLEKFIVIISYVFEGRSKAAYDGFWDVPDGALLGFVHWASKRASTPLVSAFCEMLQAIAEDEDCATAAHQFLLDEGAQASGKMRRTASLTWNQIFKELTFFSSKIRDRPAIPQPQNFRSGKPHSDIAEAEPESAMMLESYLRLITRLCSESEAARNFLAQHPTFHITDLLFQLASSAIQPRLRACAFTTLQSLLSNRTREAGEYLWAALDVWISGGYSSGASAPKNASVTTSAASMASILRGLASGFEEPNAFVRLLYSLVLPYRDEAAFHDALPFPETLGISTRQPGIDPYVDFAMGQIFATQPQELHEVVQVRLLQLTCLDFIATCLDTFNEDLVIFASQTNVSVDAAIQASSLQNYMLLHPFSRVMEWMFNEKVMAAVFAAVHQDPADVACAAPDSPLVLCLLRGIHVITTILNLQPTYLDIIRPLMKSQPNYRRVPVANAAFSCFEDGVLNHLTIFPDLGRYCGTGHAELVIASLKLLEKLSASSKLSFAPNTGFGRGSDRNRALAALDDDAEIISNILLLEMEEDIDINQGPDSSAYIIQIQILEFLNSCLRAASGQPTIAHLLLGFQCGPGGLSVESDGLFNRGVSLFHTILNLVLQSPVGDESGPSSWLVALSLKGMHILKELWTSPISAKLVMSEMRANDAGFLMFVREGVIDPNFTWDGIFLSDPTFSSTSSATCFSSYLYRRALMLQYISAELRQVVRSHSPSLRERIFETLMGSTTVDDGQKIDHATIFDLFDFMNPDLERGPNPPQLSWFSDADLYACLDDSTDVSSAFDISKLDELLGLRRAELTHTGRLENPTDANMVDAQAKDLLDFYAQDNAIKGIGAARLTVLRAWVQLTLVMVESGEFDGTARTAFVLRALQTIMPRLESDFDDIDKAMELASLAKSLIFKLDFTSDSFKTGDMGNLVSDRLFHLFQTSLRAISTLGSKVALKEYYYNICFRYLTGMSDLDGISRMHKRHSIQAIKSAGERFIDFVCDDALGGSPTCRISALLVLVALVKLGEIENSKYIIESLARVNFISILVESIQNIATDLRDIAVQDIDMYLSYCHARLALLLSLSQSRFGSAAVLNAGLFHFVKESTLFSIDPDLGVDIEGPDAVDKHYNLLAAIMRILCAAVLSRGSQNQQTLDQGLKFLSENRSTILPVLKISAGLTNADDSSPDQTVNELAASYMLLITVTGFLEFEDQTTNKKHTTNGYTVFT
ncbi:related to nucleoporin [Rhynchosporium graminicola]|uniref:Related to nucleoporin n=1 Tax=Rhynchosporium graminicola TaxID=2792576 RepID=A0A1E1K8G2_9HELO|nr:related to nucleoporin [Rhynchosporium commune]